MSIFDINKFESERAELALSESVILALLEVNFMKFDDEFVKITSLYKMPVIKRLCRRSYEVLNDAVIKLISEGIVVEEHRKGYQFFKLAKPTEAIVWVKERRKQFVESNLSERVGRKYKTQKNTDNKSPLRDTMVQIITDSEIARVKPLSDKLEGISVNTDWSDLGSPARVEEQTLEEAEAERKSSKFYQDNQDLVKESEDFLSTFEHTKSVNKEGG